MSKDIEGVFFKLKKSTDGKYFFILSDSKNKVLMTSGLYDQKALALLDIDLIRFNVRSTFFLDFTQN